MRCQALQGLLRPPGSALWVATPRRWPSGDIVNSMADDDSPLHTQPTQPRGTDDEGNPHAPIEIPVPKKSDVMRVLKKSSQPIAKKDSD